MSLDNQPINETEEERVEDFEIFHTGDIVNVIAYSAMAIGKIFGLKYCSICPSSRQIYFLSFLLFIK